jgi:hypothetical protein
MADEATLYYLVSLKHTERRHRYITFWRPNRSGYAWPLSWAGTYSAREALLQCDDHPGAVTFAVPVEAAWALSEDPSPRDIDGNAGPVVRNTAANKRALKAAKLTTPGAASAAGCAAEGGATP